MNLNSNVLKITILSLTLLSFIKTEDHTVKTIVEEPVEKVPIEENPEQSQTDNDEEQVSVEEKETEAETPEKIEITTKEPKHISHSHLSCN